MLQDELRRLGRYPLLVIEEIGYTPVRTRGRPIVPQLPIAAAAKTGGVICRRGRAAVSPLAICAHWVPAPVVRRRAASARLLLRAR